MRKQIYERVIAVRTNFTRWAVNFYCDLRRRAVSNLVGFLCSRGCPMHTRRTKLRVVPHFSQGSSAREERGNHLDFHALPARSPARSRRKMNEGLLVVYRRTFSLDRRIVHLFGGTRTCIWYDLFTKTTDV